MEQSAMTNYQRTLGSVDTHFIWYSLLNVCTFPVPTNINLWSWCFPLSDFEWYHTSLEVGHRGLHGPNGRGPERKKNGGIFFLQRLMNGVLVTSFEMWKEDANDQSQRKIKAWRWHGRWWTVPCFQQLLYCFQHLWGGDIISSLYHRRVYVTRVDPSVLLLYARRVDPSVWDRSCTSCVFAPMPYHWAKQPKLLWREPCSQVLIQIHQTPLPWPQQRPDLIRLSHTEPFNPR